MKTIDLNKIKEYAQISYDNANCNYDGKNYITHINDVINILDVNNSIFKIYNDLFLTKGSAICHDLIEDAKQSYNDICNITGKEIADIVLAVTDVPAENRLMKHLLTMNKTVKDYRAIILKMADIYANTTYSKKHNSSMYRKYVEEYAYRKPIFNKALSWYSDYLNKSALILFWNSLDQVHCI